MKRTKLFGIALVPLAIALALVLFGSGNKQQKPSFADLRAEDIEHIDVLYGGQPVYIVSAEDQELLVTYLQQVELGEPVSNYLDYDGVKGRMFLLHMKSGDTVYVAGSSPLFIVDDVGYYGDYDACHAVSKLYWRYVDTIHAEMT